MQRTTRRPPALLTSYLENQGRQSLSKNPIKTNRECLLIQYFRSVEQHRNQYLTISSPSLGLVCIKHTWDYRFNWDPIKIWRLLQKWEGSKVNLYISTILWAVKIIPLSLRSKHFLTHLAFNELNLTNQESRGRVWFILIRNIFLKWQKEAVFLIFRVWVALVQLESLLAHDSKSHLCMLQHPFPLEIHLRSVLSIQFQQTLPLLTRLKIILKKAHRGLRPHHLRISLPLPKGLPPRGSGGCWRWGGLPPQVGRKLWYNVNHSFVFSKGGARPWVWGPSEAAAHEGQIFPRLSHECHGLGKGKGCLIADQQCCKQYLS